MAVDSVENIMRNVNYGWLVRYTHAVGASIFFAAIYLHIAISLYSKSIILWVLQSPERTSMVFRDIIFIVMMATVFMRYITLEINGLFGN